MKKDNKNKKASALHEKKRPCVWKKIWEWIKKLFFLIINPRFVLCFGIGWMATNGWAYILTGFGTWLEVPWMIAVGGGYLTALWFPFTPEKLITVTIAILVMKKLFPDDEKTLGILKEIYNSAKTKTKAFAKKHSKKKGKGNKEKMDIVLHSGRPEETENRSEKEIAVYDLLDKAGVPFERADHEPAMTMEVCREIDRVLGALICKNLFLCNRQKTSFYLLMMPGDKPFKTKDLSAQIGSSRLSFADAELMEKYIGTTPGSASVLGLMYDKDREVSLLIDEDVLNSEYFGCHPCENTSSLKIKTCDLIEKILPALGHTYTKIVL